MIDFYYKATQARVGLENNYQHRQKQMRTEAQWWNAVCLTQVL